MQFDPSLADLFAWQTFRSVFQQLADTGGSITLATEAVLLSATQLAGTWGTSVEKSAETHAAYPAS